MHKYLLFLNGGGRFLYKGSMTNIPHLCTGTVPVHYCQNFMLRKISKNSLPILYVLYMYTISTYEKPSVAIHVSL